MKHALTVLAAVTAAPWTLAQTTAPAAAPAAAASAPQATLESVEIRARRDDPTAMRRNASAAKIVVGREEIEQYGDSNVGEVIRRLPGVTQGGRPGRGGDLRMRGMGSGYTQILIDGERPPPGFSVEQLSPDLVERIELIRAPTAETGTRAIAGTINIVLREPLRQRNTDVRPAMSVDRGRVSPQLSVSRDGIFGDDDSFNVTVNGSENRERTDTHIRTTFTDLASGAVALDQLDDDVQFGLRRRLNASSRIQWRLGAGEQFVLQPFVMRGTSRNQSTNLLEAIGAAPVTPYASSSGEGSSDFDIVRLGGQLTRRIGPDTRVELRGGAGRFSLDSGSSLDQRASDGSPLRLIRIATSFEDTTWSLSGKLMHSLGGGHSLVGGWESEGTRRIETSATWLDGQLQQGAAATDVTARTLRQAVYLQDEWDPAPDWSAYAGLRVEAIHTRSDSGGALTDNRSTVVSPLAHLVWRFNAPQRDQIRLSLTQSYRAPTLRNLIGVPTLSTLYPAPGANVASSPDRAGNPALEPERSHGIDLAYERYLAKGGVLSVNLFHRRISDLIRNVTVLEDVAWADVPRWVSRPRNLGRATAQGIEFDAKFRLSEVRAEAPPLDLRMNLSLFRSRVDSVPGPDNRIDQQPHAVGNLGADYKLPKTAWTVGGSLGVTPGYRTQLSEFQSQEIGLRRVLDAYLLWQIDGTTRLRLSLANLTPIASASTASVLQGNQWQQVASTGRTDTSATLRLEMRL